MNTPQFIGEIRLFASNFAPQGWAFCDGRTLTVKDNLRLFHLIGTKFGGDGTNTFNLPDLRGRVALGLGQGPEWFRQIGEMGGVEQVTLTHTQIPRHTHSAWSSTGTGESSDSPADNFWGKSQAVQYNDLGATADKNMAPGTIMPEGSNKAHDNMLPFLSINYIIALKGEEPALPFIPGQ